MQHIVKNIRKTIFFVVTSKKHKSIQSFHIQSIESLNIEY